jgi:phosphoribosylamine--glycine ligase/phosphoribosylformylglycinamidine cyclo-ligase
MFALGLLPLLSADTDLAEIMVACTEHWLDAVEIRVEPKFSATLVVIVAGGYPGPYAKGVEMKLDVTGEGKDGRIRYLTAIRNSC